MPINQLKAGAVLNYVILVLNAITGLLYTPYMLRMLGQSEYGIYSLAASVISYLGLLDFGFGNAMIRYASKFIAKGDYIEQYKLYGTFTIVYSIIGILSFIAGLFLYFNVDNLFDRTMSATELFQTRTIMMLMIINLAVSFPLGIYASIITAYEDFIFLRLVSIIRILVSTGVLIAILYMGYRAIGLVVVQTAFNFICLGINYIYCKKKLKIRIIFSKFNWPLIKEITVYSFWIFLGCIMDKIYWSTGQFVLGITVSTTAVAIYSLAITLQGMYMSYSSAISGVFLPRVTQMVTQMTPSKELSDLFIRTGRIQFIVMGFILSGFVVFGMPFIRLWAGENYSESYYISLIFFFSLLIPLIQNIGITILQAKNNLRFRSLVYLAISLISLVAQIIVAPIFKGVGCAWVIGISLLIGQGFVMNVYYWKKQDINIPLFWKEISKMSIIPILLIVCGLILSEVFTIATFSELLIGIILYSIAYIPLLWLFSLNTSEKQLISAPFRALALIKK